MTENLRPKNYFDDRATREMAKHLSSPSRDMKETLAYACRILAMTGQEPAPSHTAAPLQLD